MLAIALLWKPTGCRLVQAYLHLWGSHESNGVEAVETLQSLKSLSAAWDALPHPITDLGTQRLLESVQNIAESDAQSDGRH